MKTNVVVNFKSIVQDLSGLIEQEKAKNLKINQNSSGVLSRHASHALHDQSFTGCLTKFCAMRHIFFNLMGNGTDLE